MLFSGLGEEHTSWATTVRNASRKDAEPPEFSTITAQLLDESRILSKSFGGTDTSIALFGKSGKRKFSSSMSSNAGPSTKRSTPRADSNSKKAGYDKATAKCTHCNKSYHSGEDCWFLHPEKAKESWLAGNPVSHTEQPLNLMTIGTLPFDIPVDLAIPTPQNSQPTQDPNSVTVPSQNDQPTQDFLSEEDIEFLLTPETWPVETLVSPTIDPSVLDFDGGSEPSMDLTTAFHQGDLLQTVDEEIRYPAGDINSELSSVDWNWSQETEDAIAQELDQQEIPKDWNFSFMTIQPNALQTFCSRIQANVPANPVVYDHLSTIWHIDSGATSHICAQRSMFQEYQKTEQSAAVWTGAGPIKAIGVGSVRITLVRSSGETMVIILKGVLKR